MSVSLGISQSLDIVLSEFSVGRLNPYQVTDPNEPLLSFPLPTDEELQRQLLEESLNAPPTGSVFFTLSGDTAAEFEESIADGVERVYQQLVRAGLRSDEAAQAVETLTDRRSGLIEGALEDDRFRTIRVDFASIEHTFTEGPRNDTRLVEELVLQFRFTRDTNDDFTEVISLNGQDSGLSRSDVRAGAENRLFQFSSSQTGTSGESPAARSLEIIEVAAFNAATVGQPGIVIEQIVRAGEILAEAAADVEAQQAASFRFPDQRAEAARELDVLIELFERIASLESLATFTREQLGLQ